MAGVPRRVLLAGALLAGAPGGVRSAQVHNSAMAGQWYPADPAKLRAALDTAFEAAESRARGIPPRKGLRALIVPHAGIQYSGVVAASAYRLLGRPKNVILLGFSHSTPASGVVGVDADAYATPLGEVPIERDIQKELAFPLTKPEQHADHSVENQLPFLQRAAPGASVVPLYVGSLAPRELAAVAKKLAHRVAQGDILIASSDFTHYGESYGYKPFPVDEQTSTRLRHQAAVAFEEIGSLDVELFNRYLGGTRDTICGRDPIRLLMATLARLDEDVYLDVSDFAASGDLVRDYSTSVSYGALAFYPASSYRVSEADQASLLRSARAALDHHLSDAGTDGVVSNGARSDDLRQRGGVFVTVHQNGELRGCVGTFQAMMPVWDAVPDRTLAASTEDPRFPALTAEDGPVTLEISLLTPVKRVRNWRSFRAGSGAVLLHQGKAGTLLPQIAKEQGWNEREFLENLSRKAGLKPDAYRDPAARLYVYGAQVFAEPESASGQ